MSHIGYLVVVPGAHRFHSEERLYAKRSDASLSARRLRGVVIPIAQTGTASSVRRALATMARFDANGRNPR